MGLLLFFLTVVPLAELYVLFFVGEKIGFLPTVGFTILTAVLGSSLARIQAQRVWGDWKRSMERLESPEHSVLEGLMILVGGVLLLTPGFLTDALGFALLVPWTRRALVVPVRKRVGVHFSRLRVRQGGGPPGPWRPAAGETDVVETTAVDVTRESSADHARLHGK